MARVTRQRRRNGRGPIRREDTGLPIVPAGPGRPPASRIRSLAGSMAPTGVRTSVSADGASRGGPAPPSLRSRPRVGAYVALTKPRIIELLLVTTLPTMIVAAAGPAVGRG